MSSYDQNLLGEAPQATRAQLQEGYNVDLLAEQPSRRTSVRNPPPSQTPQPSPVIVPLTAVAAGTASGEKFGSPVYPSTTPKPSFWRTRNSIIAAILIAVIVIGAVVGGAVGGTLKKGNNNAKTTGTMSVTGAKTISSPASSSTAGTQAFGTSGSTVSASGGSTTTNPSATQGAGPSSPTDAGQNSGRGGLK